MPTMGNLTLVVAALSYAESSTSPLSPTPSSAPSGGVHPGRPNSARRPHAHARAGCLMSTGDVDPSVPPARGPGPSTAGPSDAAVHFAHGRPTDALTGFVRADGCELYYEQRGEGVPILLIPPAGTTASTWGPVTHELARVGQVVAYDRRGYAHSAHPPSAPFHGTRPTPPRSWSTWPQNRPSSSAPAPGPASRSTWQSDGQTSCGPSSPTRRHGVPTAMSRPAPSWRP